MKKTALFCLVSLMLGGVSFAADKVDKPSPKYGVGYQIVQMNDNLGGDLGMLSGRVWFDDTLGMDVGLGFRAGDEPDVFMASGKILGKIYTVKNLDVYWHGGLALGTASDVVVNNKKDDLSMFRLSGGVGAEYYVLPQLSLLTEVGVAFERIGSPVSSSQLMTFADWIPQVGVRYYF